MSPPARRVVVVGGSLGGLSAALWLRDAGWEVDVCERSPVPLEGQGAGIVLNPATIRWFVDKERKTGELGHSARFVRYMDADGNLAAELVSPFTFTSYDTLYRRFMAAFGRSRYHLSEEVLGAEQDDRSAVVHLASGEARECDLVVWADGIRSTGRRQLIPEAEGSYAGYVGWRGTVVRSELSESTRRALHDAITYCVLPNSHTIAYPIPSSQTPLMNWLWYRNVKFGRDLDMLMTDVDGSRREVSVPPGSVVPEYIAELREASERLLPGPFAELVRRTEQPFLQAIYDVDVARMAVGRMCLVGDAAVALRPHPAAGSAKAAEDGYQLGAALRETDVVVARALQGWQARQLELARSVLARSRESGDRVQFTGSWRVGDPLPYGLYEQGDSIMDAGSSR
ncbi:MAG: FAD-dependent monooxygenase [Solirubrobacterales bacterium]|nr:FAD-dependent monooxygenase [Solirubrobacterales bacterium]